MEVAKAWAQFTTTLRIELIIHTTTLSGCISTFFFSNEAEFRDVYRHEQGMLEAGIEDLLTRGCIAWIHVKRRSTLDSGEQ
jgi:hypothetical protein